MALSAKDLWQGYQSQRTELHKQLLVLSVAGLGYNLAYGEKPVSLKISFPPASDWEVSTLGFFITVIATLLVFFSLSVSMRLEFKILTPHLQNPHFSPATGQKIKQGFVIFAGIASAIAYLAFGTAMWYAMASFLK